MYNVEQSIAQRLAQRGNRMGRIQGPGWVQGSPAPYPHINPAATPGWSPGPVRPPGPMPAVQGGGLPRPDYAPGYDKGYDGPRLQDVMAETQRSREAFDRLIQYVRTPHFRSLPLSQKRLVQQKAAELRYLLRRRAGLINDGPVPPPDPMPGAAHTTYFDPLQPNGIPSGNAYR